MVIRSISARAVVDKVVVSRSEEHTSELQSPCNLVCRLLLEKKHTTLPSAATSAYSTALDTGEQVRLGVAGRILEHLGEQALQRLAHVWAGSHARREEVVARDGEVLQRQGVLPLSHGAHGFGEKGEGSGTRRRQREQIIGVLTHLRQPL